MAGQIVPISSALTISFSTTNHSLSIKLTSRNFLTWKTQFQPLLNYHKLFGFIDGSTPPPPFTIISTNDPNTTTPNPEFTEWFQKDQLLLSWIFSSLSEEVFPYIIGMTTSFNAWKALESAFGSISQNRQLQIHIESQELKKNDLSVSQYLQKAKLLADELA